MSDRTSRWFIPTIVVPYSMRRAAEKAARAAARDLAIPVPRIVWQRPLRGAPRWWGWMNSNRWDVINLNREALKSHPEYVPSVVHHEARHIWQQRNVRFKNFAADEDDATAYAYRATGIDVPTPVGWVSSKANWRNHC